MSNPDDSVSAATEPPSRRFFANPLCEALAVRLSPERAVVPPECACCGGVASHTTRESRFFDAGTILVPYCTDCHRHVSRGATRRLAVGLSSALMSFTLSCGLPLVFQPPGPFSYALIVGVGATLPFLVARVWADRRAPGHSAEARGVFFRADGVLVCTSRLWGERLARASDAPFVALQARDDVSPRWAVIVAILAVLATPFLYRFHFPMVRVVNVTNGRLTIRVDGHEIARVDATSGESPGAGATVRVPAGERTLTAIDDDGRVADVSQVTLTSGEPHLYAPGSDGTCFWVESVGYGESRASGTRREPLSGEPRFWALPAGVDAWFTPPPPVAADDRSTGGIIRTVRQAACEEAPADVQN